MGSVESESVGAVNASNESLNGMMLRSMCQADNLKLVNTFMDGAPTWANSAGSGLRTDFIAVSWSHFEAVTGCWVDRSIDIAPGGRDDHLVLAVRLDLTVAKDLVVNSSYGSSGVNPVFSLVSIPFPFVILARASFRELLRKVDVESCGDPYQATEMWKRGFESAALQCFRQKVLSKKARKTWISEFSLSQIQQAGKIRRARENMNVRRNRAVGWPGILRWGLPRCESYMMSGIDDDACQGPSIPGCGSCLCRCATETPIKKQRQIHQK